MVTTRTLTKDPKETVDDDDAVYPSQVAEIGVIACLVRHRVLRACPSRGLTI